MDITVIQRRIGMVEKFKEEIKIAKEALKNELDNDPAYLEANQIAKDAALKKKQVKDLIWGQAHARKLLDDVAANTEEINTLQEILNDELMQYYQEHKTNEIEKENGELIKFKLIAKLQNKTGFED